MSTYTSDFSSPWYSSSTALIVFAIVTLLFTLTFIDPMGALSSKINFPIDGRTVVITGGSQGMGRALGKLFAQKGANVVIVARNKEKLASAIEYISAAAKDPSKQRFHTISADVTSPDECTRLLTECTTWNNNILPDIVWANAGSAKPALFTDTHPSTLKAQMEINYFGGAYLAHATLSAWFAPSPTKSDKTRHFVMTSSTIAYVGLAGYSPYAPAKAALRSLADSLRSEVNLFNGARKSSDPAIVADAPEAEVSVHIVLPGTILSPGFEEENKTKHPVTKVLEDGDPKQSEDEVARAAIRGLERGEYMVTTQLLGYAMKAGALGGSPRGRWLGDTVASWVASIAWLFVGPDMENKVWAFGQKMGVLRQNRDVQ